MGTGRVGLTLTGPAAAADSVLQREQMLATVSEITQA